MIERLNAVLRIGAIQLSALVWIALAGLPIAVAAPGLQGEYYNAMDPPAAGVAGDFRRIDPVIDFFWGGESPDGTSIVPDDQYSERWTGYVHVPVGGNWTFTTTSNDGIRLWVNGQLLISDWSQHAAKDDSGAVFLAGSGWYPIQLEHFNDGGTATVRLYYEGPGQARSIISETSLDTELPMSGAPSVNAGTDQTVTFPATSATLAGSADDPDGIQSVSWTQVAGPAASLSSPDSLSTVVTFAASGLHTFRLTAVDTLGVSASDDVSVQYLDGSTGGSGAVTGTLRKWHKVSVTFQRDSSTSEGDTDNPFLGYRLQVMFSHPASGKVYEVPGFYAADGAAADTGANSGPYWRAHFTPDEAGTWNYLASFRTGTEIAVSLDPNAGVPTSFDGATGSFEVEPFNAGAPGFHGKGALGYVGEHYLQFAETGEFFLKGGADSPENFLGYFEFDGTWDRGGISTPGLTDGLHRFAPHQVHFDGGDPVDTAALWGGGQGRNIVGALNYLASQGMNSVYFLTYNIDGGDGEDTWVWADPDDSAKDRFDVSKLAQWERVFSHMDARGIQLHVVTQETENDRVMGGLSLARKLYFRELVARFGHHLALQWNLGEENNNSNGDRRAFAGYLRALDPYDHPITVHTKYDTANSFYDGLLGHSHFEATSIQGDGDRYNEWASDLRARSAASGRPWAIYGDEQGPAVAPDLSNRDRLRMEALWGNLCGGGAGVEWYFGYNNTFGDVQSEDWTVAEALWQDTRIAIDFFQTYLPFGEMEPDNSLILEGGGYVLAKPGAVYAVYRVDGSGATLDLGNSNGTFTIRWYDPRAGGALQTGSASQVNGPGPQWIGSAPGGGDWVALVQNGPVLVLHSLSPDTVPGGSPGFTLSVTGIGFEAGSVVRWDGADRSTTYRSPTELEATIHAADLINSRTVSITVFNPPGNTSNALSFTVESTSCPIWYRDADSDGHGDPDDAVEDCTSPVGYVAGPADDCDDSCSACFPGAAEVCDGQDNDCDTGVDELPAGTVWYRDADGDGHGDPSDSLQQCAAPVGYVSGPADDCDDDCDTCLPGGFEVCDGRNNNCDAMVDEPPAGETWCFDADGDGFGDSSVQTVECRQPRDYVSCDVPDCDHDCASCFPGAPELCDGLDNDCDGNTDEDAINGSIWYPDADGDGFGASAGGLSACVPRPGYVQNGADCNDGDPLVYPGAPEVCDGHDNSCDGLVDLIDCATLDVNGDGFVDGVEFAWMGRAFGLCGIEGPYWWSPVDYNQDGCVGAADRAILEGVWGCDGGIRPCQ